MAGDAGLLSAGCGANESGERIACRLHDGGGIFAVRDCKRESGENDDAGKKSDGFAYDHFSTPILSTPTVRV